MVGADKNDREERGEGRGERGEGREARGEYECVRLRDRRLDSELSASCS